MVSQAHASSVADRIHDVRERIFQACQRAGRRPGEVTLIAVTKTWPAESVVAALQSGIRDVGENRVQEALDKINVVHGLWTGDGPAPAWHLIGHLQTNKVRSVTGQFAILHGIDSERLVETVGRFAREPQKIMLEVNVSGEATKFGVRPSELERLLDSSHRTPNVIVEGLMTVAPPENDSAAVRLVFRELRHLAERHAMHALSMGMSNDFEVAIEEGATHIRVGRAIFGDRP
ncbi:MAG: YggS family pyridoxal phosphate-dependent enzyme [Anaerolineaceae bacterium]